MAKLILVEGEPGSGKSTSWENIPHEQAVVITPNAKPLPFRGSEKKYNTENKNLVVTDDLLALPKILQKIDGMKNIKYVLLDDFTHYFNARTMSKSFIAKKSGGEAFAKWNELASDIFAIINQASKEMRSDLFIAVNVHTKVDDNGEVNMLTPGKLLDQNIKIPSYFTYVVHAVGKMNDGVPSYNFITNNDGIHEAKTPKDMIAMEIPNDLKLLFDKIEEYNNG